MKANSSRQTRRPSYLYYSWSDFERDVAILGTQIDRALFDNIYGLPRGGLVLAVVLSHEMDLPLITDKYKIDSKTLIVDDIADSGKTLAPYLEFDFCKVATLHYKDEVSQVKPTYFAQTIVESTWVVYPWETQESTKHN